MEEEKQSTPVLIEAYVETVEQALAAESAGANRLELCGPGDGGLTPTAEVVAGVYSAVKIPIHAMIRPRSGDFNYTDEEFKQMIISIKELKDSGISGVVFGILKEDLSIDIERMRVLAELA